MKRALVILTAAFVLSAAGTLWSPSRACGAGDDWYDDVNGHWASKYVYLLWQEGVTDGERAYGEEDRCHYYPNDWITRAQLVTLLCKVFQLPVRTPEAPSYPDVPKDYNMLRQKPAWAFVEGALEGGISFVPAGSWFYPYACTPREDAVEFLIRSLDLERLARSLTPDQVRSALHRFWDWESVSPNRQESMACAILLGIIDGYQDWSLRPLRYMTRAEAAAVICRSCLIRVSASADWFSPDGDGVDETVEFRLAYLKNRGIMEWHIEIADSQGVPIRRFGWDRRAGPPPIGVTWDGTGSAGAVVPRGAYYYRAWVRDIDGRLFTSVTRPIYVEIHSLQAWIDPCRCVDGSAARIGATTTPGADRVTASFSGGVMKALAPDGSGATWRTQLIMGPPIEIGQQQALVTAYFPRAVRSALIPFERVQDLWISAYVEPNPAAWGQTLTLSCRSSPNVEKVTSSLFGSTQVLRLNSNGLWTSVSSVPRNLPGGIYPATFTGFAGQGQVSQIVLVDIRSPATAGLFYILSK